MKTPETIEFATDTRTPGRKSAKDLRSQKSVPAVLYGPGIKNNTHFSVSEIQLEKVLASKNAKFIQLNLDGGKQTKAIVRTVDFGPVHVDFYALSDKTKVTITVPIRLTGTSVGVTEGGRLYQPLRELTIRCLPGKIPSEFMVDITKLKIGATLKVNSLITEEIEVITAGERTIVVIRPPKGGIGGLDEDEEGEEGEGEGEGEEGGDEKGSETASDKGASKSTEN
ncbi:MAG: 50S ribosomal protein L25 [Rhodothermaceae bacterium]|nr:50S ribosomal protein L25 [Rhodothermaceae bacterium]